MFQNASITFESGDSWRLLALIFIDIAVPRDLDPAINELDNVYLYDIDDLQGVIELNKADRDREAIKAGRIIDEEILKFERWRANMSTTPTIIQLRELMEGIAQEEVKKTAGKLGMQGDEQKQALEKMALAIAGKVLYHPFTYLKTEQHCVDLEERIRMVRTLFGLDDDPMLPPPGEKPHAG